MTNEQTTIEQTNEPTKTRSNLAATIAQHRPSYKARAGRNNRKTQDNGDAVATALLSIPLDVLKNFSGLRYDGRRYDHLNTGHARMCIGNLIRQDFVKFGPSVLEVLASFAKAA